MMTEHQDSSLSLPSLLQFCLLDCVKIGKTCHLYSVFSSYLHFLDFEYIKQITSMNENAKNAEIEMVYRNGNLHFRLVVVCCRQIHVFSFPHSPRRLFTCETRDNPLGLCEVSPLPSADRHILCFPAHKVGAVQLVVSLFEAILYQLDD